jgi:hypothetical protein
MTLQRSHTIGVLLLGLFGLLFLTCFSAPRLIPSKLLHWPLVQVPQPLVGFV